MEKSKPRLPKSSGTSRKPRKTSKAVKSSYFSSEEGISKREKEQGFQSGFLQCLFEGAKEEMEAAEQILGVTRRDGQRASDGATMKSGTPTDSLDLDVGGVGAVKGRSRRSSSANATRLTGSRFVDSLIKKNENEKILTDRLDAVLLDLEDEENEQQWESSGLVSNFLQSTGKTDDGDVLLQLVNEFKRLSNGINVSDRCYTDITKQYVPFLFTEKESGDPKISSCPLKYKDLRQWLFSTPEVALSNLMDYSVLIYVSKFKSCPAFVVEWLLGQLCTQSCLLSLEAAFHTLSRLLPTAVQGSSEGVAAHFNSKAEPARRPKRKCLTRWHFKMNLDYIRACFRYFGARLDGLENAADAANQEAADESTTTRKRFFEADSSLAATSLSKSVNKSELDSGDESLSPTIAKEKQSMLKKEDLLQYRVQLFFDLISACLKTNALDLTFDEYFVVIPIFYRVLVDPVCQGILASVQSSISCILAKFLAQSPPHGYESMQHSEMKFEMCRAILRSVPDSNQNKHAVYWQFVLLTPCFNKTYGHFRGLLAYTALHDLVNLYTGYSPPIAFTGRDADPCYNIDHITAELRRLEPEKIERWGTICTIVLLSEIAVSIFDRETIRSQRDPLSRWIQTICSIDRCGREIKNASLELTRAKDLIVGATVKMKILLNQLSLDCEDPPGPTGD
ncbi:uncharacterized protein LOC126317126 [Schistocerca gregaria]|uniref:uncharacterized protein LOC126317126 n=1 Tax=Schistocerca gregaria TaxID=7010 RepID=UPI00211DA905|nr:uncharacterized protein LOC126317126 [Schistocerca gregaria]